MKKNKSQKTDVKTIDIKRFISLSITFLICLVLLIMRIGWIQFVEGAFLKEKAYNQQTINRLISAKRGAIFDNSGKTLAASANVDTVSINPSRIVASKDEATKMGKDKDEATKIKKEKVAKAFSDIFGLNYDEMLQKVNSTSSLETIIKKVEQDKIKELKDWMEKNSIYNGINIDEDTKRYYPYNNLASNLIGFCGDDNQGLFGVELYWEDTLKGTPGKIVTIGDVNNDQISDENEKYIPAENGSDIYLSIDASIQAICEKYLKQAVVENNAKNGGTVIMMKPSTGDILAMASYPDYDLNQPFIPNDYYKDTWDTMNSAQKTAMWKNPAIQDTYEPGSTFKVLTSAIAIEENISNTDTANEFLCTGSEQFSDTTIRCWTTGQHGYQTLRQALENSCNPAFMQLGKKIGSSTMYRYFQAFGLFDKTGIETSGETGKGSFWELNKVGAVELATMSFGQRFTITPIQLITSISAIANDGTLMKPRLVQKIVNSDTNISTNIEPTSVRQVVSKETASKVRDMMKSVVVDGTGSYGNVKGYSIGGKTGTSEPLESQREKGYVASFIAISPTEEPEIALLVAIYGLTGENYHGGQVAGPVVSQILSEVLPYIGIASSSTDNSSSNQETITVPDIRNKTVTEAQKVLQNSGFRTSINVKGDKNSTLVVDQIPKPGTSLFKDSLVVLYTQENTTRTSIQIPNLKGMSLQQAINSLKSKNLNISYEGTGKVVSQTPSYTETTEEGSIIHVVLSDSTGIMH